MSVMRRGPMVGTPHVTPSHHICQKRSSLPRTFGWETIGDLLAVVDRPDVDRSALELRGAGGGASAPPARHRPAGFRPRNRGAGPVEADLESPHAVLLAFGPDP